MFTAIVMTDGYKIVKKGGQFAELEDAKDAAKKLPLESHQMHAVIDELNLVQWKGGVVKAAAEAPARRASARRSLKLKQTA